MKVSEITVNDVAAYIRTENTTDPLLAPILSVAKNYISSYTGIPITSTDVTAETLDSHEDFYIVIMILCQDMYDNRTMYVEKNNLNKVVDSILSMHQKNLLPTPDDEVII